MAGWGLNDLKSGFDKVREEAGKVTGAVGDKAREAGNALSNLARDGAIAALPDKLNLNQSKVMTQLVEKGLEALGYKIKMDGVPGKDVLDAVNDMRKKAGLDKLGSVADFGKEDLKAIMSGLQKDGGTKAMNVLGSIGDSLKATVTDFAASLPKPEAGATRRAPAAGHDMTGG
jgi:hypothetical protein